MMIIRDKKTAPATRKESSEAIIGVDPCPQCEHRKRCSDCGLSCQAYSHYAHGKDYSLSARIPTASAYDKLFPGNGVSGE